MKLNKNTSSFEADKLRSEAESYLLTLKSEENVSRTEAESQRLLQELQVHQIELQMQNDELRQARDELEAANTELETFNYTLAHELRQHLVTINCSCQVIRKDNFKESIDEIYQGTLAMDRLIKTLLAFSNVGNTKLHRQTVDLSAIAKSVAATASNCSFDIAPGIMVDADPDLLRIVLDNLIGNACKYAGNNESTMIEFNVTSIDGKRACFVRDNGPGFDMALAEQLFLPFQRLPGTDVKGNGIGLATVEKIISRHDGRVWAESETGKGATFFFTLG